MKTSRWLIAGLLAACVSASWAQMNDKTPHAGYAYPAGACQGSTVEVLVGGQNLNRVDNARVVGDGVTARVLQYARPLNFKQLQELRKYLLAMFRYKQLNGDKAPVNMADYKPDSSDPDYEFPLDHPLLRNVDKMTADEMERWAAQHLKPDRRQQNAQLAEMAVLEIRVAPNAAPGNRSIILDTPNGLANPLTFQVGALPEIVEREPNDPKVAAIPVADLPVVLNGQIMPGDVDRFRIRARRGQQVVLRVQARALMPFLADAVPGWFQPTLALYDAKGNELAFEDDYRFDPDPVMCYKVHEDGEYEVEVRDSIYRGREDFVYRITVGELPFITRVSPMGGTAGKPVQASLEGWNLGAGHLTLDTQPGGPAIRQAVLTKGPWTSNPVSYAVDSLPECSETEPNEAIKNATPVSAPCIVNGTIARPGDVDVYRLDGHSGDQVVVDVCARRLGSPLDALVRVLDASEKVVAWNDDREAKNTGTITQHADSYVSTRLPADGTYFIQISDVQHQGGDGYGYRLRISPPQPDFTLYVTPSNLAAPAGRSAPVCVYVVRKDGFSGPVDVALQEAASGFALDGGVVPAGRDQIRMTVTAMHEAAAEPIPLHLVGRAQIGGQLVTRNALPAEDMMQAFFYRHLVPADGLLMAVNQGRGRGAGVSLASHAPIQVPEEGAAEVRIRVPKVPRLQEVKLALVEPPEGVTLEDQTLIDEGLGFKVRATGKVAKAGYSDNLIVEAYMEPEGGAKDAKPAAQGKRLSFGVLPAIPIEVVKK